MQHIGQRIGTFNEKNNEILGKVYKATIHAIFEILANKPTDDRTKEDCSFMDVFLSVIANTLCAILWMVLLRNEEIDLVVKISALEDFIDNLHKCTKDLFLQAHEKNKLKE